METIAFKRVKEPYGWLGNMAAYSIVYNDLEYRTTEALFQALRFKDFPEIAEKIRQEKSPMTAKMVAKSHKDILDKAGYEFLSGQDLDYMKICLKEKLSQHPELKALLLDTGTKHIIEDCTSRPQGSGLFWGAALQNGQWIGKNMLGELWMQERQVLNLKPIQKNNFN